MKRFDIEFQVKNKPELDPGFMPLLKFNRAYLKGAGKPLGLAVERSGGQVAAVSTFIHAARRPGRQTSIILTGWLNSSSG